MQLKDYQFSEEEILLLKKYRDKQGDTRLQKRFLALLMLAEGIPLSSVKSVIGVSDWTLERWFLNYSNKGIEALNSFQYQPKPTYLTNEEQTELVAWVKKKHPEIEK